MGWKCDSCDTYNEDTAAECYVCGQPRSAASIRAAAEKARRERIERAEATAFKAGKAAFIAFVSLSVIAAAAGLIIKIVGGSIGDIPRAAQLMGMRVKTGPITAIVPNFVRLIETVGSGFRSSTKLPIGAVFAAFKANVNVGVREMLLPVLHNSWESIKSFASNVSVLVSGAAKTIAGFIKLF